MDRNLNDIPALMDHDAINHPRHYAAHPRFTVECIELTRLMTFDAGNALKYLWRHSQKNGIEDLAKAEWYFTDLKDLADKQVWRSPDVKERGMDLYKEHVRPHLDFDNHVDHAIVALFMLP